MEEEVVYVVRKTCSECNELKDEKEIEIINNKPVCHYCLNETLDI